MSLFLIVATKKSVLLSQPQKKSSKFDFPEQGEAIHKVYPGAKLFTPMDSIPKPMLKNIVYVSVYLSSDKGGVGRVNSKFHEWALVRKIFLAKT